MIQIHLRRHARDHLLQIVEALGRVFNDRH
jgi:hypothetical protein